MNWPALKELAGFIGAVLLVIPWFRDFSKRLDADQIKQVRAAGSIGKIVRALRTQDEQWLSRPKLFDLLCTIMGLVLIAISFLIGFIAAL